MEEIYGLIWGTIPAFTWGGAEKTWTSRSVYSPDRSRNALYANHLGLNGSMTETKIVYVSWDPVFLYLY
jgi:hypothetical protein